MNPKIKTIIDLNWNVEVLTRHLYNDLVQQYINTTGLNTIEFTGDKPECIVQENDECGKITIDKINFYKIANNWIPEIVSNNDIWDYGQTDLEYITLVIWVDNAINAYENSTRI